MNRRRIVITGAPGTGKTTIIKTLQNKGYFCFEEISRSIIQEYQEKGTSNPFLSHANEFSEILFRRRIKQYLAFKDISEKIAFYDRSFVDVIAYLRYGKAKVNKEYRNSAKHYLFDTILITPPWEAIYTKDQERMESFEQAVAIHKYLLDTYHDFGYKVITIPTGTIIERVSFIENKLS